jgi:hypothetical protein
MIMMIVKLPGPSHRRARSRSSPGMLPTVTNRRRGRGAGVSESVRVDGGCRIIATVPVAREWPLRLSVVR